MSRGSHGDATVKEKSKVSKLPCFMGKLYHLGKLSFFEFSRKETKERIKFVYVDFS